MLLNAQKLLSCFQKAKAIIEHKKLLCLDSGRIPVSVDDVEDVIRDMTNYEIKRVEVKTPSDVVHVRGILERYADQKARIIIRHNQTEDWKRYVTVKELCHIALDEVEDLSTDGEKTIEKMIAEETLSKVAQINGTPVQPILPDNEVQSERLAEIMAIEIMYPFSFRKKDLEDLKAGTVTITALALHFNIPEVMIARGLARGWFVLSEKFHTTGSVN